MNDDRYDLIVKKIVYPHYNKYTNLILIDSENH